MMNIAIMQPYIFPYIGYYQLIDSVDTFVVLDDVNFITRGWINRNNILLNNKQYMFSISLLKPSQNKLISETKLYFPAKERSNCLKTLQVAYKRAPYFRHFYPILEKILLFNNDNLTEFLINSFTETLSYIGMEKKIIRSSHINKDNSLKAAERIIDICRVMGAERYINLSGGKALYDAVQFNKYNIELLFVDTMFEQIQYKQYSDGFVANLSFIDILMFNSIEETREMMKKYSLVKGE